MSTAIPGDRDYADSHFRRRTWLTTDLLVKGWFAWWEKERCRERICRDPATCDKSGVMRLMAVVDD